MGDPIFEADMVSQGFDSLGVFTGVGMTSRAVGDLSVLTELPRLTRVSSENVPDPPPSEGAETPAMADGFDWAQ